MICFWSIYFLQCNILSRSWLQTYMNLNWAGCKKKCEIFYWQCFLLSAHNLALRPQKCLKCMVKGHRFSLLLHNSIQLSWAFSKVYIPTTININYFLWHLQFIVLVVYPILTQRNNKAKLKIFHLILNFLFLFFFLPMKMWKKPLKYTDASLPLPQACFMK